MDNATRLNPHRLSCMNTSNALPLDALGVTVLERGWLSSNCTVIRGEQHAWVVDTGYCAHAEQTARLIEQVLEDQPLTGIINTHLHSDHCGGNAELSRRYPGLDILIPPGQAGSVIPWDPVALTYEPTGQRCPPFEHTGVLKPGARIQLGPAIWDVLAAPGHDPHAVLLHQPDARVLISGDALWENGFGVVFPELEGVSAFAEVQATLAAIKALEPTWVIPGHGSPFTDVAAALHRAEQRLAQFVARPDKHAEYAAKVLVKFHLLEHQTVSLQSLSDWYETTPYFGVVQSQYPALDLSLHTLVDKLVMVNAAARSGDMLIDQ